MRQRLIFNDGLSGRVFYAVPPFQKAKQEWQTRVRSFNHIPPSDKIKGDCLQRMQNFILPGLPGS